MSARTAGRPVLVNRVFANLEITTRISRSLQRLGSLGSQHLLMPQARPCCWEDRLTAYSALAGYVGFKLTQELVPWDVLQAVCLDSSRDLIPPKNRVGEIQHAGCLIRPYVEKGWTDTRCMQGQVWGHECGSSVDQHCQRTLVLFAAQSCELDRERPCPWVWELEGLG